MFFNTVLSRLTYVILCIILLMLCSSVFFFSCKDTAAIFASLETEEKIKTSNFPDRATVLGMAKLQGHYYLSTGTRMFARRADLVNWNKPTIPHGYSHTSHLVQAKIDEPIYFIAYKEHDGEIVDTALFKMTVPGIMEDIRRQNTVATLSITHDGILFASVKNNNGNYAYYRDYETDTPLRLSYASNVDGVILDVEKFRDSTYLLTQSGLFSVSETRLSPVEEIADSKKDAQVKQIGAMGGMYGTNDELWVSNKNYVWKTSDGSTWKYYKADSTTFFTNFAYIDDRSFNGLLVGTRNYKRGIGISQGYRELAVNTSSFTTPRGNKYTSGDLHKSDVLGFFVDGSTFFVLTKGSGLWRGTYSSGRAIDWFRE